MLASASSSAASPPPAPSPAASVALLSAACDAYEATGAKEAEAVLLAFRAQPRPFEATRYALQHATSARALHLSLSTHVAALVRQWQAATTDRPREAEALLSFVSERAATQPAVVRSQAVHAVAVLLKRCWLDGGASAQWAAERLQRLLDGLSAAATLPATRLAAECVQATVSELSLSSRSSPLLSASAASVVSAHSSFERPCAIVNTE